VPTLTSPPDARIDRPYGLADAGLTDVEIIETHRVHEHAGSAIVRARKPL
jgi:arsenite methyltransferase